MGKKSPYFNAGNYLFQCRDKAGFTQVELASAVGGVHSQYVSNWERGVCMPPAHSLEKIIRALKVDREILTKKMLADSEAEIRSTVFLRESKAS